MISKGKETLLLEDLLKTAGLAEPASVEAKKNTLKSFHKGYKRVLKDAGAWGFYAGLITGTIYLLKKLKIIVLLNKLIAAAVVVTTGVGIYLTAGYITKKNDTNKITETAPAVIETTGETGKGKTERKKDLPAPVKNRIELQAFTTSSVSPPLLKKINNNLFGGLKNISGKRVFQQGMINGGSIKYIILGNVEDTGNSLRVYARVIDKESSATRYMLKKEIDKNENIEERCRKISEELSRHLK